ncbi:adenylate/guanylate cyclase domain-containing protein [Roseibium suaedae]|uniref:Adenylate cyclase, class 3 n=1 Tax=Roseibium suaedae TaxID=735517 RepID=A0A1M7PKE1_9HYPH|nr:adenylate/guanylate cyclase domain-containing protein [Roseibium suaedae]SHN17585.1 Adenylate cyclase, class 3 [Roseibium suaedae]
MKRLYSIEFEPNEERAYAKQLMQRFVPLGRLGTGIGLVAFIGYGFWDAVLDPNAWERTAYLRATAVAHFLACIGLSFLPSFRTNPKLWPFLILYTYLGIAVLFPLILAQLPGGLVAGISGLTTGMIFVPAMTNGVLQTSGILVPYLLIAVFTIALAGGTNFEVVNALAWTSGGVGFAVAFSYQLDVINRRAFRLERLLEDETRRSEVLLLNILPAKIASRLKAHEEPVADKHESVSILFADLAGFSNITRKMSADELVSLLNDLFSRFDRLVDEHHVEKIKTIGDAYMAAAGLHGSVVDHAARIANLALEMQSAVREFRQRNSIDLELRIGIHSGPVIAGVIGKRKFSYDLWGDTVNVASRMESEGIPGKIQISEETQKLLPVSYFVSTRGEVQIKGDLPRTTYFLEGCS